MVPPLCVCVWGGQAEASRPAKQELQLVTIIDYFMCSLFLYYIEV